MQPDQAFDYIAGILSRHEIPFASGDDGVQHRVLYGSTAIFINVSAWGADDTVISFAATVLEDLDPSRTDEILVKVNELNAARFFSRWVLYGTMLRTEYDLLASRMQAEEFMNALNSIAQQADDADDQLKAEIGGRTWEEVEAETQSASEALDS